MLTRFVEVSWQDIRYGLRSLRRNPGFALLVVVTMALGIGANTAVFSVVNGVLLRPLPYAHPDRLVVLHQGQGDAVANDIGFSVKDIVDYRSSRSFSDVVEFHNMFFNLLGRAEPQRVSTGVVSANYFDVLGVRPLHGRTFTAADDRLGAPAVLVLSHAYWMKSFGGDPSVVGRVFRMNDKPHTVVGVLPDVPQYPVDVDVYMPTSACPFRASQAMIEHRGHRMMLAFARVKPDVPLITSAADFQVTADALERTYPKDYPDRDFHAVEVSLKEDLTRNFSLTLWILLGTAAFVLLIVCASIANLLLARMAKRDRELSVRAALGATRARLLRQLLTESILLAVTGGVLGLGLASWSMQLLVAFASRFTPRASEITLDGRVLLFSLGLSVLTGLVFGSLPAFSRRFSLSASLQSGVRATQASQRMRSALIVAQVSVSFMLLVTAGLTLRSLLVVQGTDPGIRVDNVISLRADMSFDKIALADPRRGQKIGAYWSDFEQRLRALPGVIDVGGGGTFPLNEVPTFASTLTRENHPLPPGVNPPQVALRIATPDYFLTISQPVLAGRAFTPSDSGDAQPVAIINQSLARHYWPNENPVGTRIQGGRLNPGDHTFITIVGVVADVRQQLDHGATDEVYVPLQQQGLTQTTWIVHTRLPFAEAVRSIRTTARAHDADLPVSEFRTLAEVRADGLQPRRVVVSLVAIFAGLALLITSAGIAGVIAFSVNQRTQEFGIRMALGAARARVLAMVVGEGVRLVAMGVAIGLAGAYVLVSLIGSSLSAPADGLALLVDVTPTDVVTYVGVTLLLAAVALAACALPARRAASVDPNVALRAL